MIVLLMLAAMVIMMMLCNWYDGNENVVGGGDGDDDDDDADTVSGGGLMAYFLPVAFKKGHERVQKCRDCFSCCVFFGGCILKIHPTKKDFPVQLTSQSI